MKSFIQYITDGKGAKKYKGEPWKDGFKRRVVKTRLLIAFTAFDLPHYFSCSAYVLHPLFL